MKTAVVLSVITFFIYPLNGQAQWISDIKTESDWENNFNNGFFDYSSFQLYGEFTDGEDITDTSVFLSSSMGITNIEVVGRDISGYSDGAVDKIKYKKARVRLGNKIAGNKSNSYMLASAEFGNISTTVKLRDDNGEIRAERRSISFAGDSYVVTVGNYSAEYGCGLGIGRFDYRPVSFDRNDSNENGVLFPDNSYYNGIKAVFDKNYSILYSIKKYGGTYKTIYASSISRRISAVLMGVTASHTRLTSSEGSRAISGGSLFFNTSDGLIKAEAAYGESGAGSAFRIAANDFLFKGWYYSGSYINLHSSGYARPDYRTFADDRFELSFRQPQMGEKGFFTSKKASFKNVDIIAAVEAWKKPGGTEINLDNSLLLTYPFNNNIAAYARYSNLSSERRKREIFDLEVEIRRGFRIDSKISFWVENSSLVESESYYYIFLSLSLSDYLKMGGRSRWHFDGGYDFFIEESVVLGSGLWVKATYRWKNGYGTDLGPLYIIMENRW